MPSSVWPRDSQNVIWAMFHCALWWCCPTPTPPTSHRLWSASRSNCILTYATRGTAQFDLSVSVPCKAGSTMLNKTVRRSLPVPVCPGVYDARLALEFRADWQGGWSPSLRCSWPPGGVKWAHRWRGHSWRFGQSAERPLTPSFRSRSPHTPRWAEQKGSSSAETAADFTLSGT